uniref:WD repeat-containing protein 7 n=2 Tax=Clytia hemisphaerica TaxID=252671 RepID=A0A7M5X173_9CNID
MSPNWMSTVCVIRPTGTRTKDDVLIGITVSNCLKVWTLKASSENKGETVYEEESKTLDCLKAKCLCVNPFTQRTALIISSNTWQLFNAGDFSFLAALPAPDKVPLKKGDFVATNRVLIWNKAGKAYLYKLPSRYLLGSEQIDTHLSEKTARTPALLCEFSGSPGQDCTDFPMFFSYWRRGPYYKLLIQGLNGGVRVWKVPDSELEDQQLSKLQRMDSKTSEVTISDEGVRKTVLLEESSGRVVEVNASCLLKDVWEESRPSGLLDCLGVEENAIEVTYSLYLPSHGKVVCGRSNGSIVIIDSISAVINELLQSKTQHKEIPHHLILTGHVGSITCLLYPHDENPRYDKSYLISGGVDFTVRAWDLSSRTLLHTFNCHGGEVLRLFVTPPQCNHRFLQCICSVGQDHSVAVCGLRERKVLLLASRHTFPVETIRWRVKDDFMVVGCSDGSVYVWQMETGHLDRCVAGTVGMEILESCNGETSAPSPALREFQRKFRLNQHLTNMASNLPIDITKTPQVVKRMKSHVTAQVSAIHQHVQGALNKGHSSGQQNSNSSSQTQQHSGSESKSYSLPPFRVCSLRTSREEPEIHVLLLDPEALIKLLLNEEARFIAMIDAPNNPKRQPVTSTQSGDASTNKGTSGKPTNSKIYEIAQLLLSCLHSWGLDPNLDELCKSKLGMLKPQKTLSFGLLTRGRLSLTFPGWRVENTPNTEEGSETAEKGQSETERIDVPQTPRTSTDDDSSSKAYFNTHWQLSSSLTTQHLISIVAVCNTLMSMNYARLNKQELTQSQSLTTSARSMINSEIKAGWSLLATLHCCMLPDSMQGMSYRPPLLHILARRWQDRCLEIREAAQAILLGELRRIGPIGRKQLIDAWSPHLPQDMDSADLGFEDLEQYINNEDEKTVFITAEEDRTDIAMVMMTTRKMVASDARLRHATAIIMLGVIGAEFQKEIDPINSSKSQSSDCVMDVTVVRNTALALTSLLQNQRQQDASKSASPFSAIRRAAIDLMGRGFALWEPHIDVSQVLIGLFELCADIEQQIRTDRGRSISLTAAKDLLRSSKHSLSLIATARPSACITTLAKEVARHVASSSSMSFTQPSPAAIAVYSHVRHQPSSSTEVQTTNTLHNARSEILRIMELMVDKSQHQVVDFIVEVVDIIVHMLDFKQLKDRGITEAFPSIFKFPMVSYCSTTRRLAVGSRVGHIALYELRSSRCQLIPAHENAITALAFSPEGKVLASFSAKDKKISFYQTSSSLLGMLSSTVRCIQSYSTLISDDPNVGKSVRILWTAKKHVILLLGDGSQHKYQI